MNTTFKNWRFILAIVLATGLIGVSATAINSRAEAQPDLTFTGDGISDGFGAAVSDAGDVDNDGFPDLIIGAPGNDLGNWGAGQAYIYSGRTRSRLYTFTGTDLGQTLGGAVSGAGDVNNDGFADFIIASSYYKVNDIAVGRVDVYSGESRQILYTYTGAPGIVIGLELSGGGDVNNDGYDDIVLATNGDLAYVYSGQTGELIYSIPSIAAGTQSGSIAILGDINNDGFADIVIGSPFNTNSNLERSGQAFVYSGHTGALMYTLDGEPNDEFGTSVSGAGDVNNDGFLDIIVGAPLGASGTTPGKANVYSGENGELLYSFIGESLRDNFGESVSGAGDVNNDGYDDLIVGSSLNNAGGENAGRAFIFSGKTGARLYNFNGVSPSDQLGASVSGAGDINNDGYGDIIVGAHGNDAGGEFAGQAYVQLGGCCSAPGDANSDGSFNISDITFGIAWIFSGGSAPTCEGQADADGSGTFTIADVTYGIAHIFAGGPAPTCGTSAR